jgi:hypothetical protein
MGSYLPVAKRPGIIVRGCASTYNNSTTCFVFCQARIMKFATKNGSIVFTDANPVVLTLMAAIEPF